MTWANRQRRTRRGPDRLVFLRAALTVFAAALIVRLFTLQVINHGFYAALAESQHALNEELLPNRGSIYVTDKESATGTYPLVTNKTLHLLFAVPKRITNPAEVAHTLAPFVTLPEADLAKRLDKPNDLYEPIMHNMTDEQMQKVTDLKIVGLAFADESTRYYPEKNVGGQMLGFVGYVGDKKIGQYGLEGHYEPDLAGRQGFLKAQKDASGQLIATAAQLWQPAVDGSDLILTIDRAIEFQACTKLDAAVQKHGADGGSLIIMNPQTGAILAMCGAPDYDPNAYNTVTDPKLFLNAATQVPYEPGSVFKAITMAAALNEGKVTPSTTYTDTGEVKIGSYTIKNSDNKAHGVQTMSGVLEQSLNTGAIFAMRQIGPAAFDKYVKAFGFGQPTNFDLDEKSGNISSLETGKDIYAATGAFGQGITVTPLQLAVAYAAMANGGQIVQPYIVDRIRKSDGTEVVTKPRVIRQAISSQTAATISAMLVGVVRNGHGKRAGVPGYFVAGKTGTAQIPDPKSGGYLANMTIGTFAGFAPVEDPKFVMVVRLDRPRDVQFAESSAAPLFGELAKYLLLYEGVQPTDTATAVKP